MNLPHDSRFVAAWDAGDAPYSSTGALYFKPRNDDTLCKERKFSRFNASEGPGLGGSSLPLFLLFPPDGGGVIKTRPMAYAPRA